MNPSNTGLMRAAAAAVLMAGLTTASVAAPNEGGFETGLAVGFSGTELSCDFGFARAGAFDFSAGLAAGNPWSDFSPALELILGASTAPWRSAIRIEASVLAGLAMIPGIQLGAPYGGCALGLDIPIRRSGFAIRAETLAKFGGREFAVAAVNPVGTIRYVDSWAPALIDLQVGLRWKPARRSGSPAAGAAGSSGTPLKSPETALMEGGL